MANINLIKDALSILNIQSDFVTKDEIKEAYRKAAFKYHPDRNLAGLEMMKLVNVAYETLKDFEGETTSINKNKKDFGEIINNALNAIINLGLEIEVCGAWVWVSGNTKPHKEVLKGAGFLWAPKKLCWYFRPNDYKSHNRSTWPMDQIRNVYGSSEVNKEYRKEECKQITND
ncbi:TPA: molecular chaperone DnaJ [Candidatus Dependentiae bacterium]|nr:molecular chaperone DnaJ [Candidatus Dependentiae bacterium]